MFVVDELLHIENNPGWSKKMREVKSRHKVNVLCRAHQLTSHDRQSPSEINPLVAGRP